MTERKTDGDEPVMPDGNVRPKDFEDALQNLEAIVKELEGGDLSLERSLERYEQGVRLARFCSGKLEEAEKRIELLSVTEEGEPKRDASGALRQTPLSFDGE